MTDNLENRKKRLLYRASYRGFKEADLLIGGFAKANITYMDEAALDEFEALLENTDREIYEWAIGQREVPGHIIGPVFKKLQKFDVAGTIHRAEAH